MPTTYHTFEIMSECMVQGRYMRLSSPNSIYLGSTTFIRISSEQHKDFSNSNKIFSICTAQSIISDIVMQLLSSLWERVWVQYDARLGIRKAWTWDTELILGQRLPVLTTYVILGKIVTFSASKSPHLQSGGSY